MAHVTAVSDSGPLIALTKLGVLSQVLAVYPTLIISEVVYHEVVTSGLALGTVDATELDKRCRSGQIVIIPSDEIQEVSLDQPAELHRGELETIKIALQLSADFLFIDDLDARQVAEENCRKMAAAPAIKGTLGILVELYQKKLISKVRLKEHLEAVQRRKDIWISAQLCRKLIDSLETGVL
jgi:predicted nucleic acid-binding protein